MSSTPKTNIELLLSDARSYGWVQCLKPLRTAKSWSGPAIECAPVATEMQITIRRSGVNPVSQLDPGVHIPAEWVARAVEFLRGPEGAEFAGREFSLKTDEGRGRVGLPPVRPSKPP